MSTDGLTRLNELVDELATLPAVAAQVIARARDPDVEMLELAVAEQMLFGINHAELGARILAEWNLPELLVQIVRLHQTMRINSRQLEELLLNVQSEVEMTARLLGLEVNEPAQYLKALQVAHRELSRIGLEGLMQELSNSPEGDVFAP